MDLSVNFTTGQTILKLMLFNFQGSVLEIIFLLSMAKFLRTTSTLPVSW